MRVAKRWTIGRAAKHLKVCSRNSLVLSFTATGEPLFSRINTLVAVAHQDHAPLAMFSWSMLAAKCDHSLGMRNVLLIIIVPDATNSNASGCSFQGPMLQTPQ
jgi:hypothetical protein